MTLALAAAAAAIVVALWSVAPLATLVVLALAFGGCAYAVWRALLQSLRDKPPLLAATLQNSAATPTC